MRHYSSPESPSPFSTGRLARTAQSGWFHALALAALCVLTLTAFPGCGTSDASLSLSMVNVVVRWRGRERSRRGLPRTPRRSKIAAR